jgi:hypothetical protein
MIKFLARHVQHTKSAECNAINQKQYKVSDVRILLPHFYSQKSFIVETRERRIQPISM